MKQFLKILAILFFMFGSYSALWAQYSERIQQVANMEGLIAFWDFSKMNPDSSWASWYDSRVVKKSFPVYLKIIGDDKNYTLPQWPYSDNDSKLVIDTTGPFGHAVRFNKGYIFGLVPRDQFENTALNIKDKQPFTLIAWAKFYGQRHMVTGIWDEGGWHKYSGRRQIALFAGLFSQNGMTAHISATGAASYPQSEISGSQYARERAIDGQDFENNDWVMMVMTYNPDSNRVVAMLNAKMTPKYLTDEVVQDVYQYATERSANPYLFNHSIYSPKNFVLKFNGYTFEKNHVYEHRLHVDLNKKKFVYDRNGNEDKLNNAKFRITCDLVRDGKSILAKPFVYKVKKGQIFDMPDDINIEENDIFTTKLEELQQTEWRQIGSVLKRQISKGAPFTFGRALGLGAGELSHGSQIYLDGVAVFNRILSQNELKTINFDSKK